MKLESNYDSIKLYKFGMKDIITLSAHAQIVTPTSLSCQWLGGGGGG